MSKNLQVQGITKAMLRESIQHNTHWNGALAPMPMSKALWMLANPRIEETDFCAVLTTENDQILSFISMIPDYLNLKNNQFKKVYWMVLWWAAPQSKNTVVATYTFHEALKLTNHQILIKSYAEHVDAFYNKMPFKVIASRNRHTIFFSLDASMLVGRFKFLKHIRFLLDAIDNMFAFVINKINYQRLRKNTAPLRYDYINELDEATWKFIEPLCANDLILKSKDYINWHINNRQYTQIIVPGKKLYNAIKIGTSTNIFAHSLKILMEGKIIGFISFIINYNELNVRYFLVEHKTYYNLCVDVLIEHFIVKKAKYIFTDNQTLADAIRSRFITVYTHKSLKTGIAHNNLDINIEESQLMEQDGHFY